MGDMLKRQSDRDLPRTSFQTGILDGHYPAHAMSGVILVLDLTCRSAKGRNALLSKSNAKAKANFPSIESVKDWIKLLETHMMSELWFARPNHEVRLVQRSVTKLKEVMSMTKKTARREAGMGHNTLQFHGYQHVSQSAIDFAAFLNFNVKTDESAHRKDKKTAHRTQMQMDKFDMQVAKKICQRTAVEIGVEEIRGRPRWSYLEGFDHSNTVQETDVCEPMSPVLAGVKCEYFRREHDYEMVVRCHSNMKSKERFQYDDSTMATLNDQLENVSDYMTTFCTRTELRVWDNRAEKNTQLFRASPHHLGKPWEDWALFDLSTPEFPHHRDMQPAQIKCFVDLTGLPDNNETKYPHLEPGIYCIIEPTWPNDSAEEQNLSELIQPIKKKSQKEINANFEESLTCQKMVHLSKLRGPVAVVPDLDNSNPRAYLRLIGRRHWAAKFDDWLESPHSRDHES